MKYKVIFFDVDGTLTDPQEGICKSINFALNHYGKNAELKSLTKYIGPPLYPTFCELLGEEFAEEAIKKYRERFSTIGLFENVVYDGVPQTLKMLKEKGFILCTASSKPQIYVEKILQHFDIAKYFDYIGGATLDGRISEKEDVINDVIAKINEDKKNIVMVGDTKFDLIGAEKMQIDAIGVTYGFADRQELQKYPHIAIIDDIRQISEVVF